MNSSHISTTLSSLILAAVLFFSSFIIFTEAQAIPGVGFGGPIITQPSVPCMPAPIPGAVIGIPFMVGIPSGGPMVYIPGSISYSYLPPTHINQQLLGKPGPLPGGCFIQVPCPPSPVPCYIPHPATGPVVLPILFHGSSV